MFPEGADPIIGGGQVMSNDHPIFAEIVALLEEASAEVPVAELEHTLTAGYAAALELEAERWRVERQIAATATGDEEGERKAQEIARLAIRLKSADADLTRLRELLGSLRERSKAA
jgi:hypothetical protein